MAKRSSGIDQFFLKAEQLANDFSLFPREDQSLSQLRGVLSEVEIDARLKELRGLGFDLLLQDLAGSQGTRLETSRSCC